MRLYFKRKNISNISFRSEIICLILRISSAMKDFFKIKVRNFNFGDVFLVECTLYSIWNKRAEFFSDTGLHPIKHDLTSLAPLIMNRIEF
jgi:hypothetical protein